MAGSTIYSDSKLMYFPTHQKIVSQIIGIVGKLSRNTFNDDLKEYLGEEKYRELTLYSMDNNVNMASVFYDYFVNTEDIYAIKKYLNCRYTYSNSDTVTILDPFAGEGEFLASFKEDVMIGESSSVPHLIANELELNRYEKIKNSELIDEYYNGAFEEFNQCIKNSISLLLYNPPYGANNGVRNVKHYLQIILDRKLIHNSKDTKKYDNGIIVMVIRKDDLLDTLPLIVRNFEIEKRCLYKVHKEEYDKFKQFVIFAKLRKDEIDMKHGLSAIQIQDEVQKLTELINTEPEFNPKMYDTSFSLPVIPYEEMKRNHSVIPLEKDNKSDLNNSNWKWLRELTEVNDLSEMKIDKALPPKVGELSNIIASGMINGEIRINDKLSHIIVGGTTSKMREEIEKRKDENGDSYTITKKIIYSEPYLNILVKDKGELKIKELTGGGNLD